MATFVFTRATGRLSIAQLVSADIRALLPMVGNNISANPDVEFLSELVLDECDGLNYARLPLTGLASVLNLPAKRTELHADNPIFPLLGPGTFPMGGILFYVHVGADTANWPLSFIDFGLHYKNGTGLDFEFLLGSAGIFAVERSAVVAA